MGEVVRLREANFSTPEKNFLLKLIAEKRDILVSKRLDAAMSRQKAITWNQICEIHNAEFETCRTARSIRLFWENFKRRKRHEMASLNLDADPMEPVQDEEWSKRLKLRVIDTGSQKPEKASKIYEWKKAPPLLRRVISSSLKTSNCESSNKEPLIFLIEKPNSATGLQSQIKTEEDDLSEEQVEDISELTHSSDFNSVSVENSVNSNISSVDDSIMMHEVNVKHVATSTDLGNADEKPNQDLHSLLLKEKQIQIDMLELDLMRKKLELLRDFPDCNIKK